MTKSARNLAPTPDLSNSYSILIVPTKKKQYISRFSKNQTFQVKKMKIKVKYKWTMIIMNLKVGIDIYLDSLLIRKRRCLDLSYETKVCAASRYRKKNESHLWWITSHWRLFVNWENCLWLLTKKKLTLKTLIMHYFFCRLNQLFTVNIS